jgi:hypothetical protein
MKTNVDPGIGQTQKCDGCKLVNEILTLISRFPTAKQIYGNKQKSRIFVST